jgi:acyl-CoA dehydrogenase
MLAGGLGGFNFGLGETADMLRESVRTFAAARIAPRAAEIDRSNAFPRDLWPELGKLGVHGITVPEAFGGLGLGYLEHCVVMEEISRASGAIGLSYGAHSNLCMNQLRLHGSAAQKQRYLPKLISGEHVGALAISEPNSGSDVASLRTRAEKKGDRWLVHGHKWFITGAGLADHFILIARTADDSRKGLTAFLFDADQPGWQIMRRIPIMGPEEHGGHCELRFDGLEIPDENRLMNIGDGLKVTQIRLGTARLTHCMRWLGLSKRALEIARDYVAKRESFGSKLADHEGVQWLLGEAAMAIETGRLLVMKAAWKLDQGDFARQEVSMAKIQVADTLHKAVDTALQLCGALGYSADTPLEWMYRYARQARLVDGASEVHKMVLARAYMADGTDFWDWK